MYIASSSLSLLFSSSSFSSSFQALAQIHRQFDHFVHDELMRGDFLLFITILKTLAVIGPNADPVFRDECTPTVSVCIQSALHPPLLPLLLLFSLLLLSLLPLFLLSLSFFSSSLALYSLSSYFSPCSVIVPLMMEAAQNNNTSNITQRQDVAQVLVDAYCGITHCCILQSLHLSQVLS